MNDMLTIIGFFMVVWGIRDSIKYFRFARKIIHCKNAQAYSRIGMNDAWVYAVLRVLYGGIKPDNYVFFSSVLATLTISYCWWQIYQYYPYKYRGLVHFKKPNLFKYIINSWLPNSFREHL